MGTFRRELTEHLIVLGQRHLLRCVREYANFYNVDRPYMSLDGDAQAGGTTSRPRPGRSSPYAAYAASTIGTRERPDFMGERVFRHHRPWQEDHAAHDDVSWWGHRRAHTAYRPFPAVCASSNAKRFPVPLSSCSL